MKTKIWSCLVFHKLLYLKRMDDCIFCKIVKKEVPAKYLYESKNLIVIPDINPAADVHILIISKEHISTFVDIKKEHKDLILEMVEVAQKFIKEKGVEKKYKMIFNGGSFQLVPHLHWHLVGGDSRKEAV